MLVFQRVKNLHGCCFGLRIQTFSLACLHEFSRSESGSGRYVFLPFIICVFLINWFLFVHCSTVSLFFDASIGPSMLLPVVFSGWFNPLRHNIMKTAPLSNVSQAAILATQHLAVSKGLRNWATLGEFVAV